MTSVRRGRAPRVLLALLLVGAPMRAALAQDAPTPPAAAAVPVETALEQAREAIRDGDYDGAIALLQGAIPRAADRPDELREAYLLLIKTYVFQGNDYKFKPQGRTASELSYAEARRLTVEALGLPTLRHLRPEPETEFPPEMVRLFDDVRREIFGGVRVRGVTPAGATVMLDAAPLQPLPGEEALGAVDVPAGIHLITVRHPGYETVTDRVVVAPNSTLERTYSLDKRRGTGWYATRVGIGLAVVGGLAAALLSGGDSSGETVEEPLPGPPPPPSGSR